MKNKFKLTLILISIFTLLITLNSLVFSYDTWQAGVNYQIGDIVTYNGVDYIIIQAHTSAAHWPPNLVVSLYSVYDGPPPDDGLWHVGVDYEVGDVVEYNDQSYITRQAHTSQSDWTPNIVPALFVLDINNDYKSELITLIETKYAEKELKGYDVIDVQSSVKVISYDITIKDKITGEERKVTWLVKN